MKKAIYIMALVSFFYLQPTLSSAQSFDMDNCQGYSMCVESNGWTLYFDSVQHMWFMWDDDDNLVASGTYNYNVMCAPSANCINYPLISPMDKSLMNPFSDDDEENNVIDRGVKPYAGKINRSDIGFGKLNW